MADVIYMFSLNRLAEYGSNFQYIYRLSTLVVELALTSEVFVKHPAYATFDSSIV